MHRLVGSLLGLVVIALWVATRFSKVPVTLKIKADVLLGLILAQYVLGILTLLYQVPVALGVIHQAGAILFWIGLLFYYHEFKNLQVQTSGK